MCLFVVCSGRQSEYAYSTHLQVKCVVCRSERGGALYIISRRGRCIFRYMVHIYTRTIGHGWAIVVKVERAYCAGCGKYDPMQYDSIMKEGRDVSIDGVDVIVRPSLRLIKLVNND